LSISWFSLKLLAAVGSSTLLVRVNVLQLSTKGLY
jgi:hypothetical protein